ncbi:MAG: hypothetical protein R8P61_16180 [Bacteroidia bacterium]|nr:hypothetical protein [Bacteroidia bacterium]
MKATQYYPFVLSFLLILFGCRDGLIIPSNQNNELQLEGFYPGLDIKKMYHQNHILVLQENWDRDRKRPIQLFDTDAEQRLRTIPDLHGQLISVRNRKIYVLGSTHNINIGPEKVDIILEEFDFEGNQIRALSKENSCINNKYRLQNGHLADVDQKGNLWMAVGKADPSFVYEGILQFDLENNTCSIWNTNNSSLTSNEVSRLIIFNDQLYVVLKLSSSKRYELFQFKNGDFESLLKTEPSEFAFAGPFFDAEGNIIYGQRSSEGTFLKDLDGKEKSIGSDESIDLIPHYYMDSRGNEYIVGTEQVLVPYRGYAPTITAASFLSRNGKVYASLDMEGNPFYGTERMFINALYVNPNKTSSLWIANGMEGHKLGGLVKITF